MKGGKSLLKKAGKICFTKKYWGVLYDSQLKKYTTFTLISPTIIDPAQYKENPTIIDKYNPQRAVDVSPTPDSPPPQNVNLEALLNEIKKRLRNKPTTH